jgi:hypothetical protein
MVGGNLLLASRHIEGRKYVDVPKVHLPELLSRPQWVEANPELMESSHA